MTAAGWLTIVAFVVVLTATTPLLGAYMQRVFTTRGRRSTAWPCACSASAARREQGWQSYARSVLVFSALFFGLLYLILRTQTLHPWNPIDLTSPTWDLSFNTTASFVTNTNWQFYGGETTMTYFSQMAGLAVQNFVSAAVGIAVGHRGDPRLRGASRAARSATSTSTSPARCSYVLLPISVRRRAVPGLAGR